MVLKTHLVPSVSLLLPSCIYFLYYSVTGTKVFVMPGGMMKSNGNLVELIEKVKPEIRTLIEKCNTVSNDSSHHEIQL